MNLTAAPSALFCLSLLSIAMIKTVTKNQLRKVPGRGGGVSSYSTQFIIKEVRARTQDKNMGQELKQRLWWAAAH